MSTTAESGEATAVTPKPEPEKPSSSREYIVLEQRAGSGPWTEVDRVTAADVDGALNALGERLKADNKYVAVAERYWRPATPSVETVTTVSLKFD